MNDFNIRNVNVVGGVSENRHLKWTSEVFQRNSRILHDKVSILGTNHGVIVKYQFISFTTMFFPSIYQINKDRHKILLTSSTSRKWTSLNLFVDISSMTEL